MFFDLGITETDELHLITMCHGTKKITLYIRYFDTKTYKEKSKT